LEPGAAQKRSFGRVAFGTPGIVSGLQDTIARRETQPGPTGLRYER
jgi:hypothetical protein